MAAFNPCAIQMYLPGTDNVERCGSGETRAAQRATFKTLTLNSRINNVENKPSSPKTNASKNMNRSALFGGGKKTESKFFL